MNQKVKATLFGLGQGILDGKVEVTIVSKMKDGGFVVEYEGVYYQAIRKPESGEYFVNLGSKVNPPLTILLVRPDRSAHVKDINDTVELRYILHQNYDIIFTRRLPEPYCMARKEEYTCIGLPVNEVGSWIAFSDETCLNVEGDVILMKRQTPTDPKATVLASLTEKNIRYLVKRFDLDLVLEDEQE